jgi:hypothetical protein
MSEKDVGSTIAPLQSRLTFGDNAFERDHPPKVDTPQCPRTDGVLAKAAFETDVEGSLAEPLTFLDGIVQFLDQTPQGSVECWQVLIGLMQEGSGELSIVGPQDIEGDAESLLLETDQGLDGVSVIDWATLKWVKGEAR